MIKRMAVLALPLALGFSACSDNPAAPAQITRPAPVEQVKLPGSGIVLNSLTGLKLPVLDALGVKLGTVTINQAVITNLTVIENSVGQIVGLQADGVLTLSGTLLGTQVVTQNFTTTATVTATGPGTCTLTAINLGPISINTLQGLGTISIPTVTLNAAASGLVGTLLCRVASILKGLGG
jgi:hypothetical protein